VARIDDPLAQHEGAAETWRFIGDNVLHTGVADQSLKELCFRFLSEPDTIDLERFDGRERAALEWTYAIARDADAANDDLWERLHSFLSEKELVDLGCAIGFELGRQHFLRTFGVATHAVF
jgi:alkylhydroperoxidase family enzyme